MQRVIEQKNPPPDIEVLKKIRNRAEEIKDRIELQEKSYEVSLSFEKMNPLQQLQRTLLSEGVLRPVLLKEYSGGKTSGSKKAGLKKKQAFKRGSIKCCKCHYVRTPNDKRGKLRKVRGPWSHCSYDMENCCKDKKTIISSKKKKKTKRKR